MENKTDYLKIRKDADAIIKAAPADYKPPIKLLEKYLGEKKMILSELIQRIAADLKLSYEVVNARVEIISRSSTPIRNSDGHICEMIDTGASTLELVDWTAQHLCSLESMIDQFEQKKEFVLYQQNKKDYRKMLRQYYKDRKK